MSWFNNDNVGQPANQGDKPPARFRVPVGESKEFTFLDGATIDLTINGEVVEGIETPIRLSEYRVTVPKGFVDNLPSQLRNKAQMILDRLYFRAGGWSNFSTVPSPDEKDPLRDFERPSSIVVFTVIDHSSWTSPQGKTYVDQKRLFVAKRNSPAWGILQRQIERLRDKKNFDSLRGCRFESSRHGDKTPSVGNSFDFIERVEDLDSLDQPFDYGKILAPKSADDLEALLELIHGDNSTQPEDQTPWSNQGAGSGGWGNSGDVPF
jgi:hypothetical protein